MPTSFQIPLQGVITASDLTGGIRQAVLDVLGTPHLPELRVLLAHGKPGDGASLAMGEILGTGDRVEVVHPPSDRRAATVLFADEEGAYASAFLDSRDGIGMVLTAASALALARLQGTLIGGDALLWALAAPRAIDAEGFLREFRVNPARQRDLLEAVALMS